MMDGGEVTCVRACVTVRSPSPRTPACSAGRRCSTGLWSLPNTSCWSPAPSPAAAGAGAACARVQTPDKTRTRFRLYLNRSCEFCPLVQSGANHTRGPKEGAPTDTRQGHKGRTMCHDNDRDAGTLLAGSAPMRPRCAGAPAAPRASCTRGRRNTPTSSSHRGPIRQSCPHRCRLGGPP